MCVPIVCVDCRWSVSTTTNTISNIIAVAADIASLALVEVVIVIAIVSVEFAILAYQTYFKKLTQIPKTTTQNDVPLDEPTDQFDRSL